MYERQFPQGQTAPTSTPGEEKTQAAQYQEIQEERFRAILAEEFTPEPEYSEFDLSSLNGWVNWAKGILALRTRQIDTVTHLASSTKAYIDKQERLIHGMEKAEQELARRLALSRAREEESAKQVESLTAAVRGLESALTRRRGLELHDLGAQVQVGPNKIQAKITGISICPSGVYYQVRWWENSTVRVELVPASEIADHDEPLPTPHCNVPAHYTAKFGPLQEGLQ